VGYAGCVLPVATGTNGARGNGNEKGDRRWWATSDPRLVSREVPYLLIRKSRLSGDRSKTYFPVGLTLRKFVSNDRNFR
jgi:hypothetical protein